MTFLAYSKPLRDFYVFAKVPDASIITRFKQDFLDDLQLVFDNLVDVIGPVCQAIDSARVDMTMLSHASANPKIEQLYINSHFCYIFKFGIVTNIYIIYYITDF